MVDYQEVDPFLYLAHTAQILGARRQADVYFSMVDAIEHSQMRLTPDEVGKLDGLRDSWAKKPVLDVLKHVEENYLHG